MRSRIVRTSRWSPPQDVEQCLEATAAPPSSLVQRVGRSADRDDRVCRIDEPVGSGWPRRIAPGIWPRARRSSSGREMGRDRTGDPRGSRPRSRSPTPEPHDMKKEDGTAGRRAGNPIADLLGLRTGEQDPALPPLDCLNVLGGASGLSVSSSTELARRASPRLRLGLPIGALSCSP